MTKEEYYKALESPKWRSKRKTILERDNYTCTKCGCKSDLHVHHTYYLRGKMPWDVPDSCLVTLCRPCHEKVHENRHISSFMRMHPPKEPKKFKKKKKEKPEKLKKLRFYRFMAVKLGDFKEIFDKSVNWKEVEKPKGALVKGFDDKTLAEKWLKEKPPKKKKLSKKQRWLKKQKEQNKIQEEVVIKSAPKPVTPPIVEEEKVDLLTRLLRDKIDKNKGTKKIQ